MEALDALLNRVSLSRLREPAPDAAQRELLFRAALRAPDHGYLRPWRFLTIEGEARGKLGELFARALLTKDIATPEAMLAKARGNPLRAPLLVVVIAALQSGHKVPEVEQLLSAGCAAHGMLLAAHALGLGAIWRTGELAYDRVVAEGLGLGEHERLVGFLYIGSVEGERRSPPGLEPADFVQVWS